ncbi:MAG: 2-oxoglutarate dehydrogenase E1 component [Thermoleophilia bacterium]|nr:2-oxoglutarate dehydrogenase E1 component [Thermoleophilia bacterium]
MEGNGVDALNTGYARLLLDEYLEDPASVPAEWRDLFESGALAAAPPGLARLLERAPRVDGRAEAPAAPPAEPQPVPSAPADERLLEAVAAATALVKAVRTHGHLAARLDPLGSEPPGDPALEPDRLGLTADVQEQIPAELLRLYVPGDTLADALPRLFETYCGTIAYEIEHISDHEERVWLRQAIESGLHRRPLDDDEQRRLLTRLTEVEGLERYLRRAFLGQKQFSIEGLDVMVPMLDEALELAGEAGVHDVVIGMAHRGRLNVLAHTVGRPYEWILREFEGERAGDAIVADPEGGTGDVKYHLGARGVRRTHAGELAVTLAANPSHLEAVDPVVEGLARARQTDRSSAEGVHDPRVALPVLIHGDAAFPAQGIVAETLNLSGLAGYTTGGTLHLIANNQIGFTTGPSEARSTRYSSDLAKGFDVPIVHVNADDAEAAIAAVRLALAYRARFLKGVVIDVVGYRRHGHNEQDEPAYTQPLMATLIAEHPPVREQFAERLARAGVVSPEDAARLADESQARLRAAHEELKRSFGSAIPAKTESDRVPRPTAGDVDTHVDGARLRALNEELLRLPSDFTPHEKLWRALERRREALDTGAIDWGHAEALAFATLVVDGISVRLTGQDTERGTFSHRHLVLHDSETGERYAPIQRLGAAAASFELYNSPLSELGCLGFEYGYSVAAADALVLWEAQFGDFVNGAQVILDQFVVSGLSKWRQTSRLTLLLPHGYEGNGPEHSSARLERFLQLAAQENIRIANCTTAAQYFHLLRRQALDPSGRPLVVMMPKSLLRHAAASSALAELTDGGFRLVLDDPGVEARQEVRQLVLCSGKLYYDLVGHSAWERARATTAIARIEQLYPFPVTQLRELVDRYPALEGVAWAQEEPQNMGPWRSVRHRLEEATQGRVPLRYVGRPWRASPSEGYPTAHLVEQDRIVREALPAPA